MQNPLQKSKPGAGMITIKLSPKTRHWLRVAAAKRDVSLSAFVRGLIEREQKRPAS